LKIRRIKRDPFPSSEIAASSEREVVPVTTVVAGGVGGVFAIVIAIILAVVYTKTRAAKYPQFGRKIEGMFQKVNIFCIQA